MTRTPALPAGVRVPDDLAERDQWGALALRDEKRQAHQSPVPAQWP